MGKDIKKKFTVSLDIDMKDLKKEFKTTVGNMQEALANLGNAADKMGYFKDLVSYIGQIDAALTALRNKNKDAFDNMFDGLDENLRKQLEGLFGTSGAVASQFSVLYDKMNTLTPKSGIKELRKFAKEIDSLFKTIGVDSPFENIEKQFFGKANAQHIQLLTDALNSFSTVWDGVNDKVKQGFGFGKSGDGNTNPGKAVDRISKEVQEEIDALKKQQQEIKEIVDELNNPQKVNVKLSKKSNEQVEQLKALKQAFLDATVVKQQFETSNMTGSDAYLEAVADYIKAAAELKSAFESDDLKDPAMNWINTSGLNELNDADKVLGDFLKQNKTMMTKIQNMYSEKIGAINDQIEFLASPYDVLTKKVQEYSKLQKAIYRNESKDRDDPKKLTGEKEDQLYDQIGALDDFFISLDKLGEKKTEIKTLLGDLEFGDINDKDAIEELANILGVKIPDAAKKAEDALESVNSGKQVVDSTSEDASNNAEAIVVNANKIVSAVDYAKKELVKAWQDYYVAVSDAKNNGIDVLNDDSTAMEAALDSAYAMIDKWGVNPSQKMLLTNTASKILFDELSFDDIEQFVNDQFDYLRSVNNKIQVSLDVVPAKTDAVQDAINDEINNIPAEITVDNDSLQSTENQVDDILGSFKSLVDYISQSGNTPSKFFDKLESGALILDNELHEILQSLQLIDSSGTINLESIKSGFTNEGGFVSDQYAMIARPDWYLPKIESLQPMLIEAQQAGAKIGAIVDIIEDKVNGLIYEVQNTVPGTAAFSHHNYSVNQSALNATEDQIADLVNTLQVLQQKGLFVDWGGDNVLYDENKGFSIIDLGNKGGKPHTVSEQNTMQENLDRLVSEMFKFDKSVIQSTFVDNLYKMANDSGNNVVNPYSTVSSASNKQHKKVQNAVNKVTASVNEEENAHKQNAEAIDAENLALQAQIDLKKKAQSMKWEVFAIDESTMDLKKQVGFQTLSDMEKFWKQANYEKEINWHEISEQEATNIFKTKLPQGLASSWYDAANFTVKDKIENEVLADDELRNAALNYLYCLYKEKMPNHKKDKDIKSFQDFLNTEFAVFRGDSGPLIYGDESKLSFSFNEDVAKEFDSNNIGTAKIKPKDTIGNVGSGFGTEVETFIPSVETSWFIKSRETFEDFYNKQSKEMQNEIDVGLINLEKKRVSDILGKDLSKLVSKAGESSYFESNVLSKIKQGIVPDTIDIIGNYSEDAIKNDDLADVYNNLPKAQKKLVAYYASLNAVGKTFPKQFSQLSFKKVGKDANLFNAVLNDPDGVKKHTANLTGEFEFNLFDKSEQEIKAETEALKQNTKAVQDNVQAKKASGNSKKTDHIDVMQKLNDTMNAASNMEEFHDLASIYHGISDVKCTTPSVIADGLYQSAVTGEVIPVSELVNIINDVEQKYGENLGYVKDYLQQIYGQLDVDGIKTKQELNNSNKDFDITDYAEFDKVNGQLFDISKHAFDEKYLSLNEIQDLLYTAYKTANSHSSDLDNGFISGDFGETYTKDYIYGLIDDVEQKYGENLGFIKNYLDQLFKNYNAKVDDAFNAINTSFTDPYDVINELYSINFGIDLDKMTVVSDLINAVDSIKNTDQNLLDGGMYQNGLTGEIVDANVLYELVDKLEYKYGENLSNVKDYLNKVFAKWDKDFIPELELDDNDLSFGSNNFETVKNKLDELKADAVALDKVFALSDIQDMLNDVKNNTDAESISEGKYFDTVKFEYIDWSEISKCVSDFETEYQENLDYVHNYLKQVFLSAADQMGEITIELDDDVLIDNDVLKHDIAETYNDIKSKLIEAMVNAETNSQIDDLLKIKSELFNVQYDFENDPDVIAKGKYTESLTTAEKDWTEIAKLVSDFESKYGDSLDYVSDYLKKVFSHAIDQIEDITVELDDDEIMDLVDDDSIGSYSEIYWKLEALNNGDPKKFDAIAKLQSKMGDISYDIQNNPDIIAQGKFLDGATFKQMDWTEVSDLVSDFEVKYGENLSYIHEYLKKVFAKQHEELDQLFSGADVSFVADSDFSSKQYSIKDYEDVYETQSKRTQDAINDLAEFYQFYVSMKSKINSDPIEFYFDTPMFSEVEEVLFIIDELKTKMQEVQNIFDTEDLGDDEVAKKLFELQSEAVGLQGKLRGAKLPDGKDSLLDYQNTFMLSEDDAKWMKSLVQGEDIYNILLDLTHMYQNADKTAYDLADSNLKNMMDDDFSGTFEKYLLQLADKLSAKQTDAQEKQQNKSLNDDTSDNKPDQPKQHDTPNAQFDSHETHGQDYALESTLQQTNKILGEMLSATTDNESDKQSVDALNDAVVELNKVASGIVEHQKAQKTDTSVAMAKIADPIQYKQISDIAMNSVDQLGSEVQIKGLKALTNGLVGVEGAFKNADDEWEGFTVKINEANKAVELATNKQSAFAKALNKVQESTDDVDTNAKKYDKEEVEARAQVHLDYYTQQGKNATVQFKDSGRYTITILEEIDGLTKQIFQTFDENDDKIERTTATVSNSQKVKLENLKKLIDFSVIDDTVSDHDIAYKQYKNAVDELEKMNALYKAQDDLSNEEILNWNAQIKLVQQLGTDVEKLINQRKNVVLSDVFKSDRDKKLSKFDLDKVSLQKDINIPDNFNQRLDDARKSIENAMDNDSLKVAINNWEALQNEIKQTATEQDLYVKKAKSVNSNPDQFTKDLNSQKTGFAKYKNDVQNAIGVTDDLRNKLVQLETDLNTVGDTDGLDAWVKNLKDVKTEISNAQKIFKASQTSIAADITGKVNSKFKELNFKSTDNNLTKEQEEIVNKRKELLQQIKEYNIKINSGQKAEIDGINETRDALYQLIDAYKQKHNIINGHGTSNKTTYGTRQLQTFTAKYNSLISGAYDVGLDGDAQIVARLTNAYEQLKNAQSKFVVGENLTTDIGKQKVEAFDAARLKCNEYARELNHVVDASKKLASESVAFDSVGENFKDDIDGRKAALTSFVNATYGAKASIEGFDKSFNELDFTVKNSDGTFTKMTATINKARTTIYATAGATGEITSRFRSFVNEFLGKFKSIGAYFVASFGWQEIWQQIRQGVEYVREIDSALTELKKVTNETDATYDRFLQSMSKTAGIVGSTVSELTTMAADWARLNI